MKNTLTLTLLLLVFASVTFAQPGGDYLKKPNIIAPSLMSILRPTASEVCNNNIDDDFNGLTDGKDFTCYFNSFNPAVCQQSHMVWVCDDAGSFYWVDMNTKAERFIGSIGSSLGDITWAPNGKLYACGGIPNGIWEINPYTGGGRFVGALPNLYESDVAMTADGYGNLYLTAFLPGSGFQVVKLNIATWTLCPIANLRAANLRPAGDLTFLNGMLYLSCTGNQIAKIDVRTGNIVTQTFTNSTTSTYYGMVSFGDGYLYVCDKNNIYQVDPATMVVNSSPVFTFSNTRLELYGMAAYSELCLGPQCTAKTTIQPTTTPPYCSNTGVDLKATITACNTNISSISWTTADGNSINGDQVTARLSGKYYLNYKTATETCNRIDSFNLQYTGNAALKVDTTFLLPAGCSCTGVMTIIPTCGSGNFKYDWSTGATTASVSNACAGNYSVKVTDIDLVKDTTIYFNMTMSVTGIQQADIITSSEHCEKGDGSISITNVQGGTPPYQYALNNQSFTNNPTFTQLSKGSYTIIIKDNSGCTFQDQAILNGIPGPEKIWYTKNDAFCGSASGTITIDSIKNGSLPFTFTLDNAAFNQITSFTNVAPGQRTVIVKDNYGCLLSESVSIEQSEKLTIKVSPGDTSICASDKIILKATVLSNSESVQYMWNDMPLTTGTLSSVFYKDTVIFVKAMDKNGCTDYDTVVINIKYCDSLNATCVLFPNAFSPNRDGLNDTFGAKRGSCEIRNYKLAVYNRWGQLIFQTRDISQRWKGEINGQAQATGAYLYTCTWEDALGIVHTMKGILALIR